MEPFDTTGTPLLSVVVPAHQGSAVLPVTLAAIRESDLPRDLYELIVVDDASTDGTADIAARWADRVIANPEQRGPAHARNRGTAASRGPLVMFVDADVRVHPDTLSKVVRAFAASPSVDAIFGAYDETPAAPGFVSQYRNLLHRYVHLQGAGEADTFWAGCGAVRRAAFDSAGGFNEVRYARPQIEDIELGYRLRDHGHRIELRPEVEGTHLKAWRLGPSLKTDVFDRGVPWVRLLLERSRLHRRANLNLRRGERFKAMLVVAGMIALIAGAVVRESALAIAGLLAWIMVLLSNFRLLAWFAQHRGVWFAVRAAPMNLLYYLISVVSVALAIVLHFAGPRPTLTPEPPLRPQA